MLIGLCGFAQSGKDTVAAALVKELGFTRLAFADTLKKVLKDLDPRLGIQSRVSDAVANEGWEKAKKDGEVRELLQRLGVAVREHVDPDAWVNAVMRQIGTGEAFHKNWVISDVRFPNEIKAIEKRGGELWRIERPGIGPANGHVSEHAWTDAHFDRVIDNCGSLVTLRHHVVAVAQHLLDGCCS